MRILAWNILHGGGAARIPEIAVALVDQRPDVVVLTEFRPMRGGQLRAVLADHGLAHQACSGRDAGRNAVLIASRWPVAPMNHGVAVGADVEARWLGVRLEHSPHPIGLLGVHIPDDSRPSAKARVWQGVLDVAKPRAGAPMIIAGDTNSGRHKVDEPGNRLGCVTALGKLATMGYVDAWRARHPESPEDTWSHPFAGGGRIDGIYVSRELAPRVTDAQLLHEARRAGHSDHSMVRVDLSLEGSNSESKPPVSAREAKKSVENCDFLPW